MQLANFLDDVQRSSVPNEIGLVSAHIYDKYISGLKAIQGGGFHLEDVSWELESNKIFYEVLYGSDNSSGAEVRITHTGAIDTWLNFEKASTTLQQQHRCIKDKKIQITRIFIGRDDWHDSGDDIQKYIMVMKEMTRYGIDCYYLKRTNPADVIDMTWVPQLNLLTVWKPGIGGGVGSIETTGDNCRPDLNTIWQSLLRDAKSYDQTVSISPQS
jgi:hypothetical protein